MSLVIVPDQLASKLTRSDAPVELYFPDNRHIVIGVEGSLDAYLAKAPAKDGPLGRSSSRS